ncbi:MAG: hypothetical protein ACJAZO_003917 [Myxococcota bacterium]|jgi:hypothetical protein
MGPFETHLREAIALNTGRRELYASVTDGANRSLSTVLITTEATTLPVAMWLDARARPFNDRGIPIVEADFVPMHPLPAWDAPISFMSVASPHALWTVAANLRELRRTGRRWARRDAFVAIAEATAHALDQVIHIEQAEQSHFAMTRHLLESLGLAAVHAEDYVHQDPKTTSLARDLVRLQLVGLRLAVGLDGRAQQLHKRGIGIIVNDVPAIPFPVP